MTTPSSVRLGVIGAGVMGSAHIRDISTIPITALAGVCDTDRERADHYAREYGVPAFYDHRALLESGLVDGVVIATPHYDHTPIAIEAMGRGVHVLTEKPVAVHTRDARRMIAAYEEARGHYPGLKFAVMFQQRTLGHWRKIKELIDDGELGRLVRATWIITDWFRTQAYYDNGDWRATWSGEGGGVLLNQCPHNLDLYQWFVGLPSRVTGFASMGKYHEIEVEDEVTGYFEFEDGLVGHFITTTAESPGTNRLEIVGERGKIVFETGKLMFYRNRSSMLDFIRTSPHAFDRVEHWAIEVPYKPQSEQGHRLVLENFADAIQRDTPLIAPAVEGIRSLALGNAIMLSWFLGHPVELPFDDDLYAERIAELARTSRYRKVVRSVEPMDVLKSFSGGTQ